MRENEIPFNSNFHTTFILFLPGRTYLTLNIFSRHILTDGFQGTQTTATADSKTTASITLDAGFEFKSYTCTGKNGIGEDVSQVIEVVQASVPAKPDAPTIKDKGHTDLTVTWTKPASDIEITSYTISYRDESGTEKTTTSDAEGIFYIIFFCENLLIYNNLYLEIKLGDLTPGKTYEIWVIAENDAGKSDASDTVTETTKKPRK